MMASIDRYRSSSSSSSPRSSSSRSSRSDCTGKTSGSNKSYFVHNNLNHHHNHHQQQQQKQSSVKPKECFSCHKPILERYFLKALDHIWHEDCLKCSCCNCRLGEIGSTLFTKADLILCKRDYLRMFGATGFCSLCNKQIPAFEMVMRARGNVYHLECFKCEACNHRFCVGDRFYLHDNRILCEYDYEEQMTLNQIHQQHHFGSTQTTYNHHPHNPAMPNYPQNQLYQLSSLPPGTQQPSYLQCSQFTISETEMNGKSINGCQNGTDDCPKPKI